MVANDPPNLFAVAGHLMTAPDRTDELAQSGGAAAGDGRNDTAADRLAGRACWPWPGGWATRRGHPKRRSFPAVESPAATVAELINLHCPGV